MKLNENLDHVTIRTRRKTLSLFYGVCYTIGSIK